MNSKFQIYNRKNILKLDNEFLEFIAARDEASYLYLLEIRKNPLLYDAEKTILLSQNLEVFLAEIFSIKDHLHSYIVQASNFRKLYEFKRTFVQRRAVRKYDKMTAKDFDESSLLAKLSCDSILALAIKVLDWLEQEEAYKEELDVAARYSAYKVYFNPDSVAFQLPQKIDFENLVDRSGSKSKIASAANEANYCIYCHNQEKDSCRTGINSTTGENCVVDPVLESSRTQTYASVLSSVSSSISHARASLSLVNLDNTLSGCPLDQKISEMNYLYANGNVVAALSVAMMDNPLIAATGDRICNDCIKSCIYQKQDAVNTPLIETQIMKDILVLPFGAEIYYLLTRWNPLLNEEVIYAENIPGKVLVTGLGPAGFAMTYYLLRAGHKVTAIDALKIDALPKDFANPIENWKQAVGKYCPQGFGGVSEYGITDRWDKNNLLLIRMILERFENFELKGNIKLGDDLSIKDAAKGYDYVALCLGAGKPYVPEVTNIDAKGVISAFDFLMKVNLGQHVDIKMPAIILGAGLTAIDCAVEALKYSKSPGDVSILYRRSINESPSYKLNHEELQIAINLGVKFIENTNLEKISVDDAGYISKINDMPAQTLIFAIGTHYNDDLIKEEMDVISKHKEKFGIFGDLDPKYEGSVVKAIASSKNAYKEISGYVRETYPNRHGEEQ